MDPQGQQESSAFTTSDDPVLGTEPDNENHPNDIVIAGVSCRLPESDNVEEFWQHLISSEDMMTEDDRRRQPGLAGLPKRSGKLKNLSRFDAKFFRVNHLQAHAMDPQLRLLLEVVYEAIVDAGLDPSELRGSPTGVFVGAMHSEAVEAPHSKDRLGYGFSGGNGCMMSNYVSFCFDFRGPSLTVNTACAASLYALDLAVQSLRLGRCQYALVAGSNVLLKPATTAHLNRLRMLSPDGTCKAFDASANGYARSEGIVAVLLTERRNARRAYLQVRNCRSSFDGYKPGGITYPSSTAQRELIQSTFAEAGVDPTSVFYVEAHGTGTQAGDYEECKSLNETLCRHQLRDVQISDKVNDSRPLLIGSVKSNMGHSEATSGLAGIVKVILAFRHGKIPPNLHLNSPNPKIPALVEGRLLVVTKATPIPPTAIVSLNSFGFGGAISHVILQGEQKPASLRMENVTLAFPVSSRTAEGLEKLLDFVVAHRDKKEVLALLQPAMNVSHIYRGYLLWKNDSSSNFEPRKTFSNIESSAYSSIKKRPVWFVFCGMGSQWSGMGQDLLQYPIFRQTVDRCYAALPSDVKNIVLTGGLDESCTVVDETAAICVITLALLELLKAVGVVPDGLIGHSLGEVSACCADGCLSPIQAAQLAYWRTKCTTDHVAEIGPGAMASTGLTWEEAGEQCPKGVWPACNNFQGVIKNVTVSGEKEAVEKFIAQLKEEGVFAKKIKSSGFAFHSPKMQPVANAKTLGILKRVIPDPKRQSPKWIVTSIPPAKPQDEPVLCSAEFHLNSLTNPVFFHEAITKIPQDAVVVEIGPHALLQAILKKSLSPEATLIPLQNWKEDDQAVVFMRALGECHNAGVSVNPLALMEPVNFPVGGQTPSIGHLVSWDHSDEWFVPKPEDFSTQSQGGNSLATAEFKVKPDTEYKIDGAFEIPAANYLLLAWKTLAEFYGEPHTRIPVTFSNVTFHKGGYSKHQEDPNAPKQLNVLVSPVSGHFEITEGQNLLASGILRRQMDAIFPGPESPLSKDSSTVLPSPVHGITEIAQQDIYKELLLKGYQIGNQFQTLLQASLDISECQIQLDSTTSWLHLLDAPFQAAILHSSGFSRPASIESVSINPLLLDSTGKPHPQLTLHSCPQKGQYSTLCLSFEGLQFLPCDRKPHSLQPQIEKYTLQPYVNTTLPTENGVSDQLRCMMDIVVENTSKKEVSLLQIISADADWDLAFQVSKTTKYHSMCQVHHNVLVREEVDSKPEGLEISGTVSRPESFNPPDVHHDVIVAENMGQSLLFSTTAPQLLKKFPPGGFLLLKETLTKDGSADSNQDGSGVKPEELSKHLKDLNFCHIATKFCLNDEVSSRGVLLLYRQLHSSEISDFEIAFVQVEATTTHQFSWIPKLQSLLSRMKDSSSLKRIYCISEMDSANPSGLIGMINCLRLEPYGDRLRCLYLINGEWKTFKTTTAWKQIKRQDLLMNVVKDGKIGSFRHSPLQQPIAATTVNTSTSSPAQMLPCLSPSLPPTSAKSKFACNPFKVYVITGGLGGFGLELAAWLVERGAKHLVLTSRSGVKSGYQARKLGTLLSQGAKAEVTNFDVSDMNQAGKLVQKTVATAKGLGGIFHLAGVLKDGLFENQTVESFKAVVRPKLTGAINLDRAMCAHSTDTSTLFVVFSSVVSGFGNIGQSNYAFANSAMDRLCEQRQEHGLHGLAIQWGAIGGVGMLQETTRRVESVAGTQLQPISSCLDSLDVLLNSTYPVVSCYIPAKKSFRTLPSNETHAARDNFKFALCQLLGLRNPDKMNVEATLGELGMDSVMSFEVTQLVEKNCGISLPKEELLSVKAGTLIEKAAKKPSTGDTGGTVTSSTGSLKASLCRILGLQNPHKLNNEATLAQLGLDSLMSFEISQLLAETYDTTLTKDELLPMKVSTLIEKTSRRTTTVPHGDGDPSTMVISDSTDVTASPGGGSDQSAVCSASSSMIELESPPKVTLAEE